MARIAILTTVHQPWDVRIFHKQARTLAQAGYEVVLLAPAAEPATRDGVRLLPLGRTRGRLRRMLGLTWRAFWKARALRADVYHFHDPELIPVGLALKMTTRARVIYDVHEDYPRQLYSKDWMPRLARKWMAGALDYLERWAARTLDALVVVTPSIAARFPPAKTVQVANFPLLEAITADEVRPYRQRPPDIVYAGGITQTRGAWEMMHALELLAPHYPTRLILLGKFQPPALQQDLQRSPAWERVLFLGWQEPQTLFQWLTRARVGLVLLHPEPNHLESYPTKMFEYMAAGLPVVASDFPRWREIVAQAGCGLLVDPRDPTAIAQAIGWLLDHPDEAEIMGRRGQQAVFTRYNWGHEAQKLLALYRRMMA